MEEEIGEGREEKRVISQGERESPRREQGSER